MEKLQLTLNLRKRLTLLLCLFLVGYFLIALLSTIVGASTTRSVRIITVLQDLVMFLMPAVVCAMLVTRQPATLLALDTRPRLMYTLLAICVLVVSVPAMNSLIYWNTQISLPSGIEESMRRLEETAQGTVALLNGDHTVMNLVMSILIVGVLAGLCEELLFRGAFQRLMVTGGVNPHLAIWIAALVFSLLHLQFYGFFPRLLLGAFFGYALYWSGSLWVPVILHIFNNVTYLVGEWLVWTPETTGAVAEGNDSNMLVVTASLAMTAIGLYLLKRSGIRATRTTGA